MKSSTGSAYDFRSQPTARPIGREHSAGSSAPVESEHFQPIGTKKAHYSSPAAGPFRCDNCVHYLKIEADEGTCDHPDVIVDAQAGGEGLEKGREDGKPAAVVEPGGCCSYFKTGKHEAGSVGKEVE